MDRNNHKAFLRFCTVGVMNTLIDFIAFLILLYGFGAGLLLANSIAFSLALLNSYVLNKIWTFGDTEPVSLRQIMKFAGVAVSGFVLSSIILTLASLVIHPVAAKVLAIITTLFWNYLGSRNLVFKKSG